MTQIIERLFDSPLLFAGIVFMFGYVCGSIPFGLILSRIFGLGDVRKIGSGNIGATNVLRTGNKKIAALTLVLDILKGACPVILVTQLTDTITFGIIAGLGAFIGHILPVWLKFNGGKGVATYLGILLGLSPVLFGIALLIWIVVALLFRYSSIAALCMAASMPVLSDILYATPLGLILGIFTLILFATHWRNIQRLMNGTETRIQLKLKKTT